METAPSPWSIASFSNFFGRKIEEDSGQKGMKCPLKGESQRDAPRIFQILIRMQAPAEKKGRENNEERAETEEIRSQVSLIDSRHFSLFWEGKGLYISHLSCLFGWSEKISRKAKGKVRGRKPSFHSEKSTDLETGIGDNMEMILSYFFTLSPFPI